MKKIILIITILASLTSIGHTGVSCSTDYFGNYNCNSSGDTGNWRSSTSTDYFGNDNTTIYDRDTFEYSRISCSYDYFGNYNCN